MTEINEHAYICDQCKSKVHADKLPRGWMTVNGFYGTLGHCCTNPVCQKWLRDFADENGKIVFETKPLRKLVAKEPRP